ncbi:MAG: nucleotidyltransferase family protein [Deltaproteobacteria bacterium]|nr:nucleotidyltransferase family protein [Deltaproteobacteria bacterium]
MRFACIILAAGEGRRAGGYKPLMALGQGAVVDRVVFTAGRVASDVRVVGGFDFERLKAHFARRFTGVSLVRNERWERGMFSSVQAGLAGVTDAAFVHPCDVPGPGTDVYLALAAAFEREPRDVVHPAFKGRRGHPVLLSAAAVRAVQEADPASTLRDVLAPLPCLDVEVRDDLVLRDFDTLQDLEALRALLG